MSLLDAVQKQTHKLKRTTAGVDRDARYVLSLFWSAPVLLITTIQALNNGWFDSIEKPVFDFFNGLPTVLDPLMYVITQFGGIGSVIVWFGIAWWLVNKRAAWVTVSTGALTWFVAKWLKIFVGRGRPEDLLNTARIFKGEVLSGYGFPSGHSAFVASVAGALYFQVEPKYRKYLLLTVLLVGISRMYLGAHFPLDVVGGWALGGVMSALVSLLVGNSRSFVNVRMVRKALEKRGYETESVRFLQLDARGSKPLYVKDKNGNEYFCKLFGSQEHAADFLFKLYRLFRFKNLQAEEPYLNGRRNVEIESFAALWARKSGVNVPDLVDLIKMGKHWLLIQEKVNGVPLDDSKKLTPKMLENVWRQVKKLHDIPLAHRDLRAANILIDSADAAWLIDFGFAETSPAASRMHMDNAELLMSMSLQAGIAQTVAAAKKVLGKDTLKKAIPYIQKSVFSGATNQKLRQKPQALKELRESLHETVGADEQIEPVTITRINTKKIINIALIALFIYILIPQFRSFSGAMEGLDNLRWGFVLLMVGVTALSYVCAALIFVFLASVPLRLRDASLVQLAASFMSKILPGTIAENSLNASYLSKAGLEPEAASATILAQGLLGAILFIVPVSIIALIAGQNLSYLLKVHISSRIIAIIITALVLLVVFLAINKRIQKKLRTFVIDVFSNVRDLSSSTADIVKASLASLSISVCYIVCLYFAAHALHISVSPLVAIFAYALAVVARRAVPTPGGLGPFEIALVAALVGFGVDHGAAVAVTVLYRLVTFWLPIPFSVVAYWLLQKRKLI